MTDSTKPEAIAIGVSQVGMAGETPDTFEAGEPAGDSPTIAAAMLRRLADSRWAEGHRDTDPLHAAAQELSRDIKRTAILGNEVSRELLRQDEADKRATSTWLSWDWKSCPELDELRRALAPLGVSVYLDPLLEGSDTYGFIFSRAKYSADELTRMSREHHGDGR